mmetsp:Transcript_9431/g.40047  ORF Transcript_9431/g.40047 Transcript_9431/m.40047 type:complete len:502 (-) Transcript_9431:816-2321(-)
MGVRRSLVACYALQTLARLILAFTTDPQVAVVTLFTIQALASSWGAPVMTIAIKRIVHDDDRVVSFGIFYSVMNVSALLSGVAIDVLRLAVPNSVFIGLGIASPIRGVVVSTVVSSLLALLAATRFEEKHTKPPEVRTPDGASSEAETRKERARPASFAQTARERLAAARLLCSSRIFWQFLAMGLFTVNLKQVFRHLDATFPKFAVRAFGCDAPFGLIYAVNPAMIIVFVPIVAAATVKKKHFDMIFAGAWVSAIAPFFLAFSQTYFGALTFVVVLSLGEMAWSPRWYDYTMACAPEGKEGVFGALALAPLFLAKLPTGVLGGVLLRDYCPGRKGGDCVGGASGGSGSSEGDDGFDEPSYTAKSHTKCDGFAVWGIIGLVTATSPLLIAVFYTWLKDSGAEEPSPSDGTNRESGETRTARGQAWFHGNTRNARTNPSPYARLTEDADVGGSRAAGHAVATNANNGTTTDSDSDDDRRSNGEFELVPLDPEGPRRKAAYEP